MSAPHTIFTTAYADLLEWLERGELEPVEVAVVEQAAIDSLAKFVALLWHELEPGTPLMWAPYLDLLCAELEAVTRGECRDLTINVPPGAMKSLLVSVLWPAWWWLHEPHKRFLNFSNADNLATRDATRMREVIRSEPYKALVKRQAALGKVRAWELSKVQDEKHLFENTARGFRQSLGIRSKITGKRGHVQIHDDLHDVSEVTVGSPEQVMAKLMEIATRVDKVLPTRFNHRKTGVTVGIMQRLHDEDTAGRRIRKGKTKVVCLPMRYDPEHPNVCPDDPRTEFGELLHTGLWEEEDVAELEADLGDEAPGQLDQRPVKKEGGLFKSKHFTPYPDKARTLAKRADLVFVSVDATFKGGKKNDFVVAQVWAGKGKHLHLLDQVHARMAYGATKQALRDVLIDWPEVKVLIIEEKANGAALIDELHEELPVTVVGIDPKLSKYARAQQAAAHMDGNTVHFPQWCQEDANDGAPTTRGEFLSFPRGSNDDRVDAASQAINWYRGGGPDLIAVDYSKALFG